MKITKEHVGRRIRKPDWNEDEYATVLFVGEEFFFYKVKGGLENINPKLSAWDLIEPVKKPSERITEIRKSYPEDSNYWLKYMDAIIQYMDEEAEKSK